MQTAVESTHSLVAVFRGLQAISLVCLLVDGFAALHMLPPMAALTHAIASVGPSLVVLSFVFGLLLVLFGMLLYATAPYVENLTRADLLAGYMFNGLLTSAPQSLLALVAPATVFARPSAVVVQSRLLFK